MQVRPGYILAFTASFLLVLGMVAAFNYRMDPAHLFDDGAYAKSAADLMAGGKDIRARNLDERLLQRFYGTRVANSPDILILGSSRIMQIDTSMVSELRLYNAGVSTSTLPDLLALTEIFVARKKQKPRYIIIGIDPWLFEAKPRNKRWQTLAKAYRAMSNRLGNGVPFKTPSQGVESVQTLISFAYLERSIAGLNGNFERLFGRKNRKAVLVVKRQHESPLRRSDGSLAYGSNYKNRNKNEIVAAALAQGAKHITGILRSDPLDPKMVRLFDRLLGWLNSQQIKVVLLLTPFHPAHYEHVRRRDQSHSLDKITATVEQLAHKNGISLVGSFDPSRAGCSDKEFWDGMHARPNCLRRILSRYSWRAPQ